MEIKDRILKSEKLEWRKLRWLQAENLKDPKNLNAQIASLRKNGIVRGFHVWEEPDTGEVWIIDGHQMQKSLKVIENEGGDNLPDLVTCYFVDCQSKKEAAEFVLLHSSSYANLTATGVQEHIANFDLNIEELTSQVNLPDFSIKDIEKIINREQIEAAAKGGGDSGDDFSAMQDRTKVLSAFGDRFEFESDSLRHVIQCNDSTKADAVKSLWDGVTPPVLMVTDPPYGVEYDPEWRHNVGKSNSNRRGDIKNDDRASWAEVYANFPGNVAYVWHGGKVADTVSADLQKVGFEIAYQIIWVKPVMVIGRGDYHWQHEPLWYAVRKGKGHGWTGDRKQKTTWFIEGLLSKKGREEQDSTDGSHGSQKPLECFTRPMRNNSIEGDGVFDPFVGSGTSLIAAEVTKRNLYGQELFPYYMDEIIARYISYKQGKGEKFSIKKNGKKLSAVQLKKYVDAVVEKQ